MGGGGLENEWEMGGKRVEKEKNECIGGNRIKRLKKLWRKK